VSFNDSLISRFHNGRHAIIVHQGPDPYLAQDHQSGLVTSRFWRSCQKPVSRGNQNDDSSALQAPVLSAPGWGVHRKQTEPSATQGIPNSSQQRLYAEYRVFWLARGTRWSAVTVNV